MSSHRISSLNDRYFGDEELCRLYRWLTTHELIPEWSRKCFLVRFALGTGLRVAELAALHVQDCRHDGMVTVRRGKGGKARQTLVTPQFKGHYQRWLDNCDPKARMDYVFRGTSTNTNAGPISTRALESWWNDVCKAAGIRNIGGIHGARHTYATWALATEWLREHELQQCLGHSTFATTADFYAASMLERKLHEDAGGPQWPGEATIRLEKTTTNVVAIRR